MKRYRKEKRAAQRHALKKYAHHASVKRENDIHITPRYDGYKCTEYITDTPKTRDIHAMQYVKMVNAINDIFTPSTPHTYLPRAPYHKHIITATDHLPPDTLTQHTHISNTKLVKAIIYSNDRPIWYGWITRTIDIIDDDITVTLYRNKRTCTVKPYIPDKTYGHTFTELCRHNIEFYKID